MSGMRQSTELARQLFTTTDEARRDVLVGTLAALDDPRAGELLWRVLTDRSAPLAQRSAA